MISKILSFFTVIVVLLTSLFSGIEGLFGRSDVVILYTNDVHCGVDDEGKIGYAGLAAYKKNIEERYENVTLVDCGDFVQGGQMGTVSSGEYIVEIMNEVGYDMVIPGNHEFDYGMEQLGKLMTESDFDYLNCNITYTGSEVNPIDGMKKYEITDYGDVQVGFVGVTTPDSITSSTPTNFKDKSGNIVYDFGEDIFADVQKNVAEARLHGADYVVVLSHLGDSDEYSPCSSRELIENTAGIDAVLDGHAHHAIENCTVKNKLGKDTVLSSTGTKLESIGQLKISADGEITAELISDYTEKDASIQATVESIKERYEAALNVIVGESDFELPVSDENGVRTVRTRETALGDLCADAYREYMGADIGLCNGGGVRTNIKAGSITIGNIIDVNPFGNTMCVIEVTGQQIADALEWTSRLTEADYESEGRAIGENGGFLQVSGLRYTIDTSVPSAVQSDENGMFSGIDGNRRVKDIAVLQNGVYVPLEMSKTYTVAGTEYVLKNNGDGQTAFDGAAVITAEGVLDYEVLIAYITRTMNGKISDSYASTQGRITVK